VTLLSSVRTRLAIAFGMLRCAMSRSRERNAERGRISDLITHINPSISPRLRQRQIANLAPENRAHAVALAMLDSDTQGEGPEWHQNVGPSPSAERHVRYRSAAATELKVMTGRDLSATIVCVTNRPEFMGQIHENIARQVGVDFDVVVVLHGLDVDLEEIRQRFADLPSVYVRSVGADSTLGDGLNLGIELGRGRYIAKFDDDDLYGPNYLFDQIVAHQYARAAIVGKHTYLAYLRSSDQVIERFPGHEHSYVASLAGGTLVLDRSRLGVVRFPSLDLGEDQGIIRNCLRHGMSVYSTDRFNYVQIRGGWNTWVIDDDRFAAGATRLGSGPPEPIAFV